MKLIKIIWFFRLVVYSLINPNISPYGYIGRPIYIHNLSRLIIRRKLEFSRSRVSNAMVLNHLSRLEKPQLVKISIALRMGP